MATTTYVDDEINEDVINVFKRVWYDMRKRCDGCSTILTDENMIKDCEFCQDYCQECEEDHEYNCAPHNPHTESCACHVCEYKRLGDLRKRCDCKTILTEENMIKCDHCQDWCKDCEEDHEYHCALYHCE